MVSQPGQYVTVAWHQSRSGSKSDHGDGWYKPEAWDRPEYHEGTIARYARGFLSEYLLDTPVALAHIAYLIELYARPPGRAADRAAGPPDLTTELGTEAVRMVATWLDEALYGQGRDQFPEQERYPLQATADLMARGDFCRMDFRRLVADCLGSKMPPEPIRPYGRDGSARLGARRMA